MQFHPFVAPLVLAALASAVAGCGTASRLKGRIGGGGEEPEDVAPEVSPAAAVQVRGGTVRIVRATLGFVLIERSGTPPPPRTDLTATRKGEPVAHLRVSPEAKTGFIVADILTGEPKVGDAVMWTRSAAPPAPEPELPPPVMSDFPPLEPLPDPRNLRPLPGIETPAGLPSVSAPPPPGTAPEAELEAELRGTQMLDPEP